MTSNNFGRVSEKVAELPQDHIKDLIYQIRRLMQAGSLYTKELNKNYQVSAPQLHCLLALYEFGPLPPSRIANYVMVKSSTITGVIDRLEHKGLVRRTRNSPDRRVINIELTDRGKTLAENAPSPIQQKIVDGVRRLPKSKVEEIIYNLQLLTHMLDVQDLEVEQPNEEFHTPL
ncbi:MAG: MarR family transcriptional regulator [Deltaproteobacteria bacterium]|nr:MarR family transcriptional regulator [Deltaproteobacteria bacterium]